MNESSKGPVLFDAAAAESVMSAYRREGIDLMLDLEHYAVMGGRTDALAWYQIEVRNGDLMAVNVRWTPEGATRLREKRQRYISPAFTVDENDRVTSLTNCALTSLPATYHAPALVAASKGYTRPRRLNQMNVEIVKSALDALANGDADAAMGILQEMIAAAASGEEPSAEAEPEGEALADPPADESEEDEEETMADPPASPGGMNVDQLALSSVSADDVATWRASHIELQEMRAKIEAQNKAIENADRERLVADLIRLGAETPATARTRGKLAARLASEPVVEMKARVAALSKTRAPAPVAPRSDAPDGLSDRALEVYNRLPDDAAKARFLKLHTQNEGRS